MIYLKILISFRTSFPKVLFLSLYFLICVNCWSQSKWILLDSQCDANLRGLSAVNDKVVWASGSNGTWMKTIDGGNTWHYGRIDGAYKLDFRDIHATGINTAWVLSAGDTGRIYKTSDGGISWSSQYENYTKGIFFDGFAFWDEENAIAYSDPIDETFFLVITEDGGETWTKINTDKIPKTLDKEAGFAASGTGICTYGDSLVWIASGGGEKARVFKSANRGRNWTAEDTPMVSGEGKGIFSMVFSSPLNGIVVGGSYLDTTNSQGNCATTNDGGKTWQLVTRSQPNGYRSCIAISKDGNTLVTVGRTGSEYSTNGGEFWKPLGRQGFFSCAFSNSYIWAVGRNGITGKLDW